MVENNDLRETLQSMQAELINLLNQQNDDYDQNDNNTEVRTTQEADNALENIAYSILSQIGHLSIKADTRDWLFPAEFHLFVCN